MVSTSVAAKRKLEQSLRQVEQEENNSASDSEDSFLADDDDELQNHGAGDADSDERNEADPDGGERFAGFSDIESGGGSDPGDDDDDVLEPLKRAIESASQKPVEEEIKIKKRRMLGLPFARSGAAEDDGDVAPAKKKITLDDIRAHTSSSFATRSIARLGELEKRSKGKSEIVKSRLGRRLEVRVDRAAAYEIAKENVSKWEDTVKRNREAEHLEFPLQPSATVSADVTAGLGDDDEIEGEKLLHALEDRELTLEEVKQRRQDLRRMRELMFREEMKAKRVKKIKSKMYRKVHKRERERAREVAAQLNESSGAEDDEDDYEKMVKRARERMDLRHKNTSKWARDVKRMNLNKDKATRGELEEMLRRGEDLTRKIDGSEDESSDDELPAVSDVEDDGPAVKGIMGMKFMKDAEDRMKKQNNADLEELRRLENGEEAGAELEEQASDSALKVLNSGRRKYAPGTQESKAAAETALAESNEAEDVPAPLAKKFASIEVAGMGGSGSRPAKSKESQNPWMQEVDAGSVAKGGSLLSLSKDSTRGAKAEARLKRAKRKTEKALSEVASGTAEVQIDLNEILQVHGVDDDADADADADATGAGASRTTMIYNGGRRAKLSEFQQRELVKRAFAGDDVVREFEDEKQRVIEDEGDKEIDMTLPGWGSWVGTGLRKPQKRFVKKVEGVAVKNRKDAKLKNVIVNEKASKKSVKYTAAKVPYPYETREQYERALRMPIGKEWSTQTTVQRLTKPKIIVKPGVVVEPLASLQS